MAVPKYKRVLLKLSGESLGGGTFGIDPEVVGVIADEIRLVAENGVQMGIVVGGGNIWRGAAGSAKGMDRVTADHIGMLATVMNSLAPAGRPRGTRRSTRVQTAIEMRQIAEPYIRRRAIRHLEKGRVVILPQEPATPIFPPIPRLPCEL